MDQEEKTLRKELNLVNAERSYNMVAKISLIAVICVSLVSATLFIYMFSDMKELSNRIVYIDNNGMVGSGNVKSMADKDIVEIQVKAAVKYAVPFLYSFNSANYDSQIDTGLKLFGNCGKRIHTDYINQNVREQVLGSNLEVDCSISDKDIVLIQNGSNVQVQLTFSQSIKNGNAYTKRTMSVKMDIVKTKVSEVNPFGYLIENWVLISETR